MTATPKITRVLTGYRPTGKMHLGHWFGNLQNMIALQETYECFWFIADMHALTSHWQDSSQIEEWISDMVLDWCAAGIDPNKAIIYKQSDIAAVSELTNYLSYVTPMSWLERVPTYKEQIEQVGDKDLSNVGFFLYPLLMCADITIMRASHVPVGEDQVAHLEFSREVVRRFNNAFKLEGQGKSSSKSSSKTAGSVLVEPFPLLSDNKSAVRVPGSDGRKMSKSYGNAIFMSDEPATIRKTVMSYMTDPARKLATDPGNPAVCPLHQIHQLILNDQPELSSLTNEDGTAVKSIAEWESACKSAAEGCVKHKTECAQALLAYLEPFQTKRAKLAEDSGFVDSVLQKGKNQALPLANQTIADVKQAAGL